MTSEPKLIAISGPSKGTIWQLKDQATIGRDPKNEIHIHDRVLSRKHSEIVKTGEEFLIRDMGSLNGTIVDGIPIQQQTLNHGAHIAVGDSILVFALESMEADTEFQFASQQFGDSTCSAQQAIYPDLVSRLPRPEHLKILLKMSMDLNRISNSDDFWKQFLEMIEREIRYDAAAAITISNHDPIYKAHLSRCTQSEIEESIVEQVRKDSNGRIFSNLNSGKSVLCVPVLLREEPFAILYLISSREDGFEPSQLQLLSSISTIASVSLELLKEFEEVQSEKNRLQMELSSERVLIGESQQMKTVQSVISRAAKSDATVLICGESGTGKEIAARLIHDKSDRNKQPFVAINCAALPEALLESELFGHEKGAFTGAINQVKGKIEIADRGTLFLDEIGDMALPLQAKLLRVLEEREIERLGGRKPIKVNIRVLAATNKELDKMVIENSFRKDLYYRLNVVTLKLPALRERKSDIPLLANYFLLLFGRKMKRKISGFSSEALDFLCKHDWPGNVRELQNAIERAVVLGFNDTILPEDLPENILEVAESIATPPFYKTLADNKRDMIIKALKECNGNYSKAAEMLGLSRTYLHRLAKNLNIK